MDEQMFCFQCEQAANGTACTGRAGVCGKSAPTAAAQDRLTGALIRYAEQLIGEGRAPAPEQALLLMQGLFTTITNVNFDEHTVGQLIEKIHAACPGIAEDYDMQQLWQEPDPDVRSLKCFVLFSLRGMAAYNYHARVLGRIDPELDKFYCTALKAVGTSGLSMEELWLLVQRTGEASFRTMELLDHANTGAFGEPEPTEVPLTIEKGPFIVISGHDLYDTQQLLAQTEGKGINVYTHSELLPAHGEAAGALQYRHHGVAAGGMGADLLALFKGEQGHAHQLILHQGAADDLTGLIVHLFPQLQGGLLFDILIHDTLLLVP